jgi:Chalcone isomerase-like
VIDGMGHFMKKWMFVVLFCAVAVTGVRENLYGALIEGVEFKDSYSLGDQKLFLNNVALMRYKVVIKAMVSALYLGEGVKPSEVLKDVPKRIEIHYFWNLEGKEIAKAADRLLAENISVTRLETIRTEIDEMNALFENVKAGERYSLTYIPGVGTELALNGKKKGLVPGAEFASAYFSIWLGKKPMDVVMRDTLLKPR